MFKHLVLLLKLQRFGRQQRVELLWALRHDPGKRQRLSDENRAWGLVRLRVSLGYDDLLRRDREIAGDHRRDAVVPVTPAHVALPTRALVGLVEPSGRRSRRLGASNVCQSGASGMKVGTRP